MSQQTFLPQQKESPLSSRNDEWVDLIARCAIRDQAALKQLFQSLGPYLNAVAFRIVKSEESSNEVLQEAFLQIWENAQSYRPHKSKAMTWLTSIVRYRALDRLKAEQRKSTVVTPFAEHESADDYKSHAPTPEEELQSCQLSKAFRECMSLLSEDVRLTIELAYLQGYSREQIADYLKTNVNTIKSWLHRGAKRLKACLEGNSVHSHE